MASTPIKIKRIPRPTHKLKTLTRLTSGIVGSAPIVVARSGLTYTVSLDSATFPSWSLASPLVQGDIFFAAGPAAIDKLSAVAAGSVLLSGTTPTWGGVSVAAGGTGAASLTGILRGNGTSPFTTITSSTVGDVLRVNDTDEYAFGAVHSVRVTDFAACADNPAVDDSVGINAAITHIFDLGGGEVIFKSDDRAHIQNPIIIKQGVILRGSGPKHYGFGAHITAADDLTAMITSADTTTSTHSCGLVGMVIDANASNFSVTNAVAIALLNSRIHDCSIENGTGNGIHCTASTTSGASWINSIQNNHITNFGGTGIAFDGTDSIIAGNYISTCVNGIFITNTGGIRVQGNQIEICSQAGIICRTPLTGVSAFNATIIVGNYIVLNATGIWFQKGTVGATGTINGTCIGNLFNSNTLRDILVDDALHDGIIGENNYSLSSPSGANVVFLGTDTDGWVIDKTPGMTISGGASDITFLARPALTDTLVSKTSTDTLTNKTLTSPVINTATITTPDINGGTADSLTSLSARSSGTGAFDLILANTENLTASRQLLLHVKNASRSISLGGNIDLAADLTTSGANALTLTTTGATNVTFPTSGTLATVDTTAWASFSPTIASVVGTITTVGTVTARYKTVGKICYFRASIAITTVGTGSNRLTMTLPETCTGSPAGEASGVNSSTGVFLSGTVNLDSQKASLATAAGAFPCTDGQTVWIAGFFEVA